MAHTVMQDALSMKRAEAGRKGGKAPHKGLRGFAADKARAAAAGAKGAKNGWKKKRSELDKFKLGYEYLPSDPVLNKRIKKAKK